MSVCHDSDATKVSLVNHHSVVLAVPAYNEARFIQSTLESIRDQSHRDFAVLIADNASTDATEEICRRFSAQDSRFTFVRHDKNIGAARNFDFTKMATSSPYFAWVGGHDRLHPEYLAIHLRNLISKPEISASFSYFELIDELDRSIGLGRNTGAAAPTGGKFFRYLWSAAFGADLGPIHGVYRRELMSQLDTHPCFACDHIFLSNTLYHGPFASVSQHLYCLRAFDEIKRPQNVMERIVGASNVSTDFHSTIAYFLQDFDLLIPPNSRHRHLKPLVRWSLQDRFLPRPFRMTKLLRSVCKRIHDVRQLVVRSK